MLGFLASALLAGASPPAHQATVSPPRLSAEVVVDGQLIEEAWSRAARLSDFSQYSPSDGRPAEEPTEVLLWYSATAIHFGIRVKAAPSSVRAHLADRDRGIIADDYVEIQLGTFNNGREIFVFAANPLGIQADGTLTENGGVVGREQADLSPDYTWDSKGFVTDDGYQIEIRIPFKSLRFPRIDPQTWSLQIIRKGAANGREDTWAPVLRAAASFVAQSGTIVGLTGIRQGMLVELNPVATSSLRGSRGSDGRWEYDGGSPEFGGNVRWGISSDVTVNATINPDFSHIEADAAQIAPDPRTATFFQEKRPFFLDGFEYFATPNRLIDTRRIVAPVAAAKLAGRSHGVSFGFLSAVDDKLSGRSGDNPVYNIVRLQRDVGRQSRIGFGYTDRIDGDDYNRVGQLDTRLLFGGAYSFTGFAAVARTRAGNAAATAPSWSANLARSGRTFGWQLSTRGVSPDFRAGSGFVSRYDLVGFNFRPSVTVYGNRGAFVERFVGNLNLDLMWTYHDFFDGKKSLERKLHPGTTWTLRGGWTVSLSAFFERFAADPALYADYAVELPGTAGPRDTVAYLSRKLAELPNYDVSFSVDSPEMHGFELVGNVIYGQDENFLEWSSATIWLGKVALTFKPTDKLRSEGSFAYRHYSRKTDGTTFASNWIPRLKVEYQLSRAVFVRLVGEYNAVKTDSLHDDSRTGAPILIRDPLDGIYKRRLALAKSSNNLRIDALFSFQPTPGTVFFAGYGSILGEERPLAFSNLIRRTDGFFTKLSYNFRI